MSFDSNDAFTPKTKDEKRKEEEAKKQFEEKRAAIRDQLAELANDKRYPVLKEKIKELRDLSYKWLLSMDLNDPRRFPLQAEAKVVESIIRSIEVVGRK